MRYTFKCPKCNSNEVLEIVGNSMNQHQKISLSKWGLKSETLDRYVCISCGYTEEYVQLNEKFQRWARKTIQDQDRKYDDFV